MVSVAPKSTSTSDAWLNPSAPGAICTKRELRILQVFSVLSMGGAETWLMSLLKYFKEHREQLPVSVKFDILLTGGTEAIFDDEARDLGARLFYVPFTRRNMIGFVREFRRILTEGNYDAIHDHQDYIAGLHFFMGTGKLPRIRVAHVHNPFYHRTTYANRLRRRAANALGKRLLGQFATHIMGTSRQIVTEYGLDNSHSRGVTLGAVHCGFEVANYQGDYKAAHADLCAEFRWEDSVKIILFVGRLESEEVVHLGRVMTHKNPGFALSVARECISRDAQVRFLMVGSGEIKRREFESRVREWGLADEIRVLGVRRDVPQLMLGSDLLLFPSLAEGLGMVVVEAQAAGLQVLASDTTPRECVVVPRLVGFQALEGSMKGWADEVQQLLNQPRTDVMSCNAAVRDSAFSVENSVTKLLQLYM